MQSENCSEQVEQVLNESSTSQLELSLLSGSDRINNTENYNYVINIFVLVENKCNSRKKLAVARKACGWWTGNYDPICSGLSSPIGYYGTGSL